MSDCFVEIALPLYVHRTFTYRCAGLMAGKAKNGCRALVQFGRKPVTGFIVAVHDVPPDGLDPSQIKDVDEIVDEEPILSESLLELTAWVADYYFAPWGEVIKAALPAGLTAKSETFIEVTDTGREKLAEISPEKIEGSSKWQALEMIAMSERIAGAEVEKHFGKARASAILRELERTGAIKLSFFHGRPSVQPKLQNAVRLVDTPAPADAKPLTTQQSKVLDALFGMTEPVTLAELLKMAEVTPSVVRTLERKGYVEIFVREVRRDPLAALSSTAEQPLQLTSAQSEIFEKAVEQLNAAQYATFLLHGVTGSGKTEVYLRVIRAALGLGKSALMLVPEIGLTPMFSRRLKAHFGDLLAILHSGLSDGERLDEWNRIRLGEARVVIGTRSAVFSPLQNLALIVVDEEHDPSYKQDETPRYHGRDTAIVRAQRANAVVLLGSATPSLESFHNAHQSKYRYFRLPERIGSHGMAKVEVVDMRDVFNRHGRREVFSDELKTAIRETWEAGKQSLILINRRGFSAFVICRKCGTAIHCPNCAVTLTFHREQQRLICHYCNHQSALAEVCPQCGGQYIQYVGEGSEKIEAMLRELFPKLCVARMDRDTTRRRGSIEQILRRFADGEIDLLVGTQMIAKGHDFPRVTLVGVVSIDTVMMLPDFRGAERAFQLLTQVAGRSGRGEDPGRVIIQTYYPSHYAILHASAQDYESFYQQEISFREQMHYPPFVYLVNLVIRQSASTKALDLANETVRALGETEQGKGLRILGPSPAPLSKLKGEFRFQVLVKARHRQNARIALDHLVEEFHRRKLDLKSVTIEVDPLDLM